MAANIATLKLRIQTDASGTVRVLDSVGSASRKAGDQGVKSFARMDASAKSMTATLLKAGAAIGGLYAVKSAGQAFISAASDLEETQGKFDVVFRGMTASAEQWSTKLRDAYAMSETESKKYLSSIQDLLVPTGMARAEAGKLSKEFVKMAADLGSFNNRDTADVIMDIQSALQGSSETMAKYGVNVKAAKVEQEILNQGWATSKDEITDAHKAMAIYNIMMRDGADAVGDMARTSDSYANQLKKAEANVDDLKSSIGNELLPVATEIVTEFNAWIKANEGLLGIKIKEFLQDTISYATRLYERIDDLVTYTNKATGGFRDLFSSVKSGWELLPDIVQEMGIVGALVGGAKARAAIFLLTTAIGEAKKLIQAVSGNQSVEQLEKDLERAYVGLERLQTAQNNLTETAKQLGFGESIQREMAEAEANIDAIESKLANAATVFPSEFEKGMSKFIVADGTLDKFDVLNNKLGDTNETAEKLVKTLTPDENLLVKGQYVPDIVEPLKEAVDETKSAADEIESIWENTRDQIQNTIKSTLDDLNQGDFDGLRSIFERLGADLGSVFSANLSQQIVSGFNSNQFQNDIAMIFGNFFGADATNAQISQGVLGTAAAGISAATSGNSYQMGGTALGAGAGAFFGGPIGMAVGASAGNMFGSLFGGGGPSYGDQLADAVNPLVEQLRKNALATESNTNAILNGKDYSSAALISEYLEPGLLMDSVFKDRSILENVKIPSIYRTTNIEDATGGPTGKPTTFDAFEDLTAASADELNQMFSALFTSMEDDIGGLITMLEDFSANDIRPLVEAMFELPGAAEVSADTITGLIDALQEGSTAERNQDIAGPYITAWIDEFKATMKNEMATSSTEMQSSIQSFAESFDILLDIEGFTGKMSAAAGAVADIDDTFGTVESGLLGQISNFLSLIDDGVIVLDEDQQIIETVFRNFADGVDAIKEGVEEFYAAARQTTLAEMNYEVAAARGAWADGTQLSGMTQTMIAIQKTADSYTDTLIDQGMAAGLAAAKGAEYAKNMKDIAWETQLSADRQTLLIQKLNLLGKTEEATALQRAMQIKTLENLYGAGTAAFDEMKNLQWQVWNLSDAADDAARAVAGAAGAMSAASIAAQQAAIAGTTDVFNISQSLQKLGFGPGTSISNLRTYVSGAVASNELALQDTALSLGLTTQQYLDAVKTVDSALDDMADTATAASNAVVNTTSALESYIDSLQNQISSLQSIDDFLYNLRGGGDLAPVQSLEFFDNQYANAIRQAYESGSAEDVQNAISIATDYLEFAKIAGGNYADIAAMIESDMTGLGAEIGGGATLDDLQQKLIESNEKLQAIQGYTGATAATIADAIGKSLADALASLGDSTGWDAYGLNMDLISDAVTQTLETGMGDIGDGYEIKMPSWGENAGIEITKAGATYTASAFQDGGDTPTSSIMFSDPEKLTQQAIWNWINNTPDWFANVISNDTWQRPAYATGGEFIAGDGGVPELVRINPGSSASISSGSETARIIGKAVKEALQGANLGSNGGSITVEIPLILDGREIDRRVVETLQTNPDAQYQVNRIYKAARSRAA